MEETVISAGFGGQGIMVLGKFLANAGMLSGLNVTYLPAYGAEVRGGTAHSMVRISSRRIGSPVVGRAGAVIIMNEPSLAKFGRRVAPEGGLLVCNTSMVPGGKLETQAEVVEAPLTDLAMELGNVKVANMIAAGIFAAKKDVFGLDLLSSVIERMAGDRKDIIPVNIKAIKKGFEIAAKS
jgi:2-oxoglutarate ferredoxin oxidoreductase subunit gamma